MPTLQLYSCVRAKVEAPPLQYRTCSSSLWLLETHESLSDSQLTPKGREANGCVYKCHKNKPQDVFLFSPVILVFTQSFKALKNPGTPVASWGDFLQLLLVHR